MISPTLTAPIDYEAVYAAFPSDAQRRFAALSLILTRMENANWLGSDIHSINVIDWDERGKGRKYNLDHVPMRIFTPAIFEWYRQYAAVILQGPESARQVTLAQFFFDLTPTRDIVVISFDLEGSELFSIRRKEGELTVHPSDDPGASYLTDRVYIKLNPRIAAKVCKSLTPLVESFRSSEIGKPLPDLSHAISLSQMLSDIKQRVAAIIDSSESVRLAADSYVSLLRSGVENLGSGREVILRSIAGGDAHHGIDETYREARRILLVHLALQAFVIPESLQGSYFALIPGIAQLRRAKPMVSGGYVVHYRPSHDNEPHVPLDHWHLLATAWAREKATFDLSERAQMKEQSHAVAFATHVLRTPLLDACRVAGQLSHSDPYRSTILRKLDRLLDLQEFSRLAFKGETQPNECFTADSWEVLVTGLDRDLQDLCLTLSQSKMSHLAGMTAYVAGDRSFYEAIAHGVRATAIPSETRVRWSWRQCLSVMDGLLTNALTYGLCDAGAEIHVWCEQVVDCIFLCVRSTCDKSPSGSVKLVKDLNAGGDADWIGVNLIHLATNTCRNYASPQWTLSQNMAVRGPLQLLAKVQIAQVIGDYDEA